MTHLRPLLGLCGVVLGVSAASGCFVRASDDLDVVRRDAVAFPAGARRLVVDSAAGRVTVQGGAAGGIEAAFVVRGKGAKVTTDLITEPDGETVYLEARCTKRWHACAVDWTVTVPSDIEVVVETGSGDVEVSSLAPLPVRVGDGGAAAPDRGPSLQASTGSGDIALDDLELLEGAHLETGSGDLDIDGLRAPGLDLSTGSGDVSAYGLRVPQVSADTGSGSVRLVFEASPRSVSADTGSGEIHVTVPPGSYALDVDTGSGDREVTGIVVDEAAERRIALTTGSGDVTVAAGG